MKTEHTRALSNVVSTYLSFLSLHIFIFLLMIKVFTYSFPHHRVLRIIDMSNSLCYKALLNAFDCAPQGSICM